MGGVSWNNPREFNRSDRLESPPTWVVWVEISSVKALWPCEISRHPHGWCELKFCDLVARGDGNVSPPTWVVWVEIFKSKNGKDLTFVATHMGGVSWNRFCYALKLLHNRVATHMGGVSWNREFIECFEKIKIVATHMGGVSWNQLMFKFMLAYAVATHMGGVSWNKYENEE